MKQLAILLIALFLLPKPVHAQSVPQVPEPVASDADEASWDRLSMLDPGAQISIRAAGRGPIRCQNVRIGDWELSCDSAGYFARSFDFSRSAIEQVDLRHDRRNFWIGVGAISALGFAVGAAKPNLGPNQPRAVNGLIDASLLGLVSAPFVYATVHWIPGKTIYRRPLHHGGGSQ
jgi:hypothetical protein